MATKHRDLQIDEDYAFQKTEWTVQRIGWATMALVVLAAMLGLFGKGGPFATAAATAPGETLSVEYQRFTRPESTDSLLVRIAPAALRGGEARLWFARDYLEGMQLESVTPEPIAVETGANGLTFVFRVADPSAPVTADFRLVPLKAGRRQLQLGLRPGEPLLSLPQFIYP